MTIHHPIATIVALAVLPLVVVDCVRLFRAEPGSGPGVLTSSIYRIRPHRERTAAWIWVWTIASALAMVLSDILTGSLEPAVYFLLLPVLASRLVSNRVDN